MNEYFLGAGSSLVPARDIELIDSPPPPWKTSWDQARQLARNGRFDEAIIAYEAAIAHKKTLEEAQGEYARLLSQVGQYEKALPILERLLQSNPERLDNLFALSRVMLVKSHYERAIDLLGKLHEKQKGNSAIIAGLIRALLETGKRKEALAFLEILHQAKIEDNELKKAVIFLAYDLGEYEKVKSHIVDIAGRKEAESEILLMAARVHDRLGLEIQARDYWQRIADLDPANTEALARLVGLYEKQGKKDKVLVQLLAMQRQKPSDADLLMRIGNLHLESGQKIEALPYLEKSLEIKPENRQVLRTLITVYAALGNKDKTLEVLERYYAVETVSEPINLKDAARRYDATGRFREAFPLYRRLLELSPDDPEILTTLASDLLAIGENEGGLAIWKHPAGLPARGLEVLRSIADLLERLGREDDLLELLELIHDQASDDDQVTLKLAIMTLTRGDLKSSQSFFEHLDRRGFTSPEFFVNRGRLFQQLHLPSKALRDYEALLRSTSAWDEQRYGISRQGVHRICLRLSGALGLLAGVKQHFSGLIQEKNDLVSPEDRLVYAGFLRDCGEIRAALIEYGKIVDQVQHGVLVQQALIGMALVHQTADQSYESEQMLRIALARADESCDALAMIFDATNKSGRRGDDAWVWLVRIADRAEVCGWDVRLFEAKFFERHGEHRDAGNVAKRILEAMMSAKSKPDVAGLHVTSQISSSMELGRIFYALQDYPRAAAQFLAVIQEDNNYKLEALVFLEAIHEAQGGSPKEIKAQLVQMAEEPSVQLQMAEWFGKMQFYSRMYETAKVVYSREPESVKAALFMNLALEQLGDISGALAGFEDLARKQPDCDLALTHITKLLFRLGRYAEALARCEALLALQPGQPALLQLKARILWAQNNWGESIKVYESYLAPAADDLYLKIVAENGVAVAMPQEDKPWWNLNIFDSRKKQSFLDRVVEARHAADNSSLEKRTLNILAAPFFAKYCWQKQFAEELAARRFVQRKDYFQAVNQYEQLLRDYPPVDSLMFDLAGIYSQLDRLGEEATIYERLIVQHSDYPGLSEAIQRNRFKRRPRIAAGYGYKREEGWNDYLSMEKEWEQVSIWTSPFTRQEFEISAANITYDSIDINQRVKAKRAEFSYQLGLFSGLVFEVGAGIQDYEKIIKTAGLLHCAIFGKVGDRFSARLSYNRDVVDDTTASLARNLIRQDMSGGISLSPLPRLQVGGDYGYLEFSDENNRLQYTLWISSVAIPDPTFLRIGYSYEFKDSREGPRVVGTPGIDGFASDDHPYWAPKNYWINQLSFYFKHRLSDDPLARDVPRFYTIEYCLGYDSNGNAVQKFRGGGYFEISDSVIAESSAGLISSPTHRSKDLLLTLAYRW